MNIMDDFEQELKEQARMLFAESVSLEPGSIEEVDLLERSERLIVKNRLYEIIKGKSICRFEMPGRQN